MSSIAVNVAILDHDRVLLTQREDFEFWCLPGGGVEAGETLAQAATREAQEETGLQVELTRLVGFFYRPGAPPWGGHIAVFAALIVGGEMKAQKGEVNDLDFFPASGFPADTMPWSRRRAWAALDGVGGSPAWRLLRAWPFAVGVTNQDVYAIRDHSSMARAEFYRQQVAGSIPPGEVCEAPGGFDQAWLSHGAALTQMGDGASPGLAVNVAIIQDGKVLLMLREDYEIWGLPGGMVEEGESLAQAARREVLEEVGLEVQLTRLVGVYSDNNLFHHGVHGVLFTGEVTGGEIRVDPHEGLQACWFDPRALPADLQFGVQRRVQDVLAGAGGSVLWRQESPSPFPAGMSRQALYALRDQSGLSRVDFWRDCLHKAGPLVERLEVG